MGNSNQWPKGKSGNPTGRPLGARNKATIFAEQLFAGEAEALTRKAIELALKGDTTALKLCLERVVPPQRDRTVTFDLRPTETVADASKAISDVLKAVSEGCLTPAEAEVICQILQMKGHIMSNALLEERLLRLEVMHENGVAGTRDQMMQPSPAWTGTSSVVQPSSTNNPPDSPHSDGETSTAPEVDSAAQSSGSRNAPVPAPVPLGSGGTGEKPFKGFAPVARSWQD